MDKDIIGIAAGILTAVSLVPQVLKSIREKKVSMTYLMFLLLLGGNGLWIWYGIRLQSYPIIVTNAFSFMMDITMIALRFRYSKK